MCPHMQHKHMLVGDRKLGILLSGFRAMYITLIVCMLLKQCAKDHSSSLAGAGEVVGPAHACEYL